MNKFDQIRSLDKKLKGIFSNIKDISKEDPSEAIAFNNLIKGFNQLYSNIKSDLVNPYYEEQNPNIEDKIIERLEALVKVMNIILDFEE
jgi:archaellum component FlaC